MKRKILFNLGIFAISVVPISTVISCSNIKENKESGDKSQKKDVKNQKPKIANTPQDKLSKDIESKDTDTKDTIATQTSKYPSYINTPEVQEDGFYLLTKYYDGELRDNNKFQGQASSEGIVPIAKNNGWDLAYSVMLGNNDSFFMLYDKDDSDGLSPTNFTDTVFFNDTSIMWSQAILDANEELKNIKSGNSIYAKFIENDSKTGGNLNQFFGSQSNHHSSTGNIKDEDFQNNLKIIKEKYQDTPNIITAIFNYYGMKQETNDDGNFLKDTVSNYADRSFAPVVQNGPLFTYERVNERAIKITYHWEATYSATAAKMILKNGSKYNKYGSFSIGKEKEWDSYRHTSNAKYAGYKPE